MNLSIAIITAGKPYAERALERGRQWATDLGAELVVAGDKAAGYALAQKYADVALSVDITNGLGESVVPLLANTCAREWVLRFDDDELGTPAMLDWLSQGAWQDGPPDFAYSFPRMWLWGDAQHFITDTPLWTDVQTRLMRKEQTALWANQVHAGAPAARGAVVPAALLHYKLLVRSFAERQATARIYDALQAGAGTGEYYGRFTLPELFYVKGVHVREVGDGAANLDAWANTGEVVPCSRNTGRDTTLIGKGGWGNSGGNHVAA